MADMNFGAVIDEHIKNQAQEKMAAQQTQQVSNDSMTFSGTASESDVVRFNQAVNNSTNYVAPFDNRVAQSASSSSSIDNQTSIAQLQAQTQNYISQGADVIKKLESKAGEFDTPDLEKKFSDVFAVVKDRLQRIKNIAVELNKNPDLSQAQLMHIQYEVMEMSIVLDVASKVGDKGSQALQTLFRNQ